MTEDEVQAGIARRLAARQAKDYEAADAVRKELESSGIMLMDVPGGTVWRPGQRVGLGEAGNSKPESKP